MIKTPHSDPESRRLRFDLGPLLNLGPLALLPDPEAGIKRVRLSELGMAWSNVFQELVVKKSSDLFESARAAGEWCDLFPAGAQPLYAVLRFHFARPAETGCAEIWPPHTLVLTPASAAESIEGWLISHRFAFRP